MQREATRALPAPPVPRGPLLVGPPPAPPRTLVDVLDATAARYPGHPAIDDGVRTLDYRTLRAEAGRTAALLAARGVRRGDRVGIRIPSGGADLYVAILGVLLAGATYVPVDADDPPERAALVFGEANVRGVLTGAGDYSGRGSGTATAPTAGHPTPADDAWVIFTSGTTGRPKGVAVSHRSAAAFVDAEAHLFLRERPLGPVDRVLGSLSVAFDASCEEMWLAWRHGACLVPAPRSLVRSATEIGDHLAERGITVVSTVPTLAGLWSAEQCRGLRLLVLGGEACPDALAHRLAGVCDEVWNTYGPTETTVVACAARLTADRTVRIGLPLAGWSLAVVDPERDLPVDPGEVGELVIAGVGTARYLDPAKDAAAFAPLPALGWRRAYRSGDLVRADPAGLAYIGRADAQVKIRGYRVELSEVEAVLTEVPGITAAVVATHSPAPGVTELAGHYRLAPGAVVDEAALVARLRSALPAHMVPAYLQEIDAIPTLVSGKVDRSALPAPTRRRGAGTGRAVPAADGAEAAIAAVLAEVLGVEEVSVTAHVVDELGATSLTLAHAAARLRERTDLPPVAIREMYLHPTVRALAAALAGREPAPSEDEPAPEEVPPAGTWTHRLCGVAQLLVLVGMVVGGVLVADVDVDWVAPAQSLGELYLHITAALAATLGLACVLPIAAKWVLVGRWRPRRIRLWSLDHVRFWTVATLVRASPLALMAGSPLYVLYLRALGARIGRGAVILSRTVPVVTDLVEIGAGAVVRTGVSFSGYHAHGGRLRTGAVRVGAGAVVGEGSLLDVDTGVGEGAHLAHASSLAPGQRVPDGEHWHGTPARPAEHPPRRLDPVRCPPWRRVAYALAEAAAVLLGAPLVLTAVVAAARALPELGALVLPGPAALASPAFYARVLALSALVFTLGLGLALVVTWTLPRTLHRLLRPGRVHPLYGPAWAAQRGVERLTNVPFFLRLYGDSSYVVGYLRALGYGLSASGQTGSNAGAELRHANPYTLHVGAGTMLSDGVELANVEVGASSFRVGRLSVGARSFLGNALVVPAGADVGDDVLVGSKTAVPLDGRVRSGVGLLGSPAFEIPRARTDDPRFRLTRTTFRRRLAAKNRHNLRTIALFLVAEWVRVTVALTVGLVAVNLDDAVGFSVLAGAALCLGVLDLGYRVVVERASTRWRALTPRYCSIYDQYFWSHERFWKLSSQPTALNGTPFKSLVWRLLGVRIGRRVFDDGASISEKSLVAIGDDATLNAGVILQAHSMEDGVFKSDHIDVGPGVTLAPLAFVHYGTSLGERSGLGGHAFLTKGGVVPAGRRWAGNPAAELP